MNNKKSSFIESLHEMDSQTLCDRHVAWSIRQKELLDERVNINHAIDTIEQIKHAYMEVLLLRQQNTDAPLFSERSGEKTQTPSAAIPKEKG